MEIQKTTAGNSLTKKHKTSISDKIMMVLVTLALGILFIPKSLAIKLDPLNADTSVVLVRFDGSFNEGGQISANKSVPLLKSLCGKSTLKTLILHMSSDGGNAVEGERIADAVNTYCEKKHVIALIESNCLSACYGVASSADVIWTSQSGFVGSIGAMINWIDYSVALERQGVKEVALTSGDVKSPSMGHQTPTTKRTDGLRSALTASGFEFARVIRERRNGRISKDAPIEQGDIYAPTQSLALGLIDDVKTIDNVRDKFGNDLTEIGAEATGSPLSLEGCSRGEDLFDLAMQKARESIQASK